MSIEIKATIREDLGKGSSRRLRHAAKVPAVVYGAGEPQSITFEHKDLWKAQESEQFYSSILKLDVDGKSTEVIIKDLQRHPAKNLILHADLQRVDAKTPIVVRVPVHFENAEKSHGVKMQGGSVQYISKLVNVKCLPKDLPEYISMDLIDMKAGDIFHISKLDLPKGVTSVELARGSEYDLPLVQMNASRKK